MHIHIDVSNFEILKRLSALIQFYEYSIKVIDIEIITTNNEIKLIFDKTKILACANKQNNGLWQLQYFEF